jgi:DNA-directed RNA polymerase subunit beta
MQKNLNDEIRIPPRGEPEEDQRPARPGEAGRPPSRERKGKKILIEEGVTLDRELMDKLLHRGPDPREIRPKRAEKLEEIRRIEERTEKKIQILKKFHEEKIQQMRKGDELAPGVIKMVKVFVAMKRKLSVGDKMGRAATANKGVIAKILPIEDMPYMPDGTPVDVVLNPLGVPRA